MQAFFGYLSNVIWLFSVNIKDEQIQCCPLTVYISSRKLLAIQISSKIEYLDHSVQFYCFMATLPMFPEYTILIAHLVFGVSNSINVIY